MNKKILYLLVVATGILALFLAMEVQDRNVGSVDSNPSQVLVPDLESNLSTVRTITIAKSQDKPAVTLNKKDETWVVEQKNDYQADNNKINKFLISLADATLLEAKTKQAKYYSKLGVAELPEKISEDSNTVQLDILNPAGKNLTSLLIGDFNPGANGGTYVRRVNEELSWLASGDLSLAADPKEWLNKAIVHVTPNSIQRVTIKRPKENPFVVLKDKPTDEHYTIAKLPEGSELASENAHDSLSNGLRFLRLNDVLEADAVDLTVGEPTSIEYQLFDGLLILASITEIDDKFYLSLTAKKGKASKADVAKDETSDITAEEAETSIKDLAQLQKQFAKRIYSIPAYKAAAMNKVLADFLVEEPEEETVAEAKEPGKGKQAPLTKPAT